MEKNWKSNSNGEIFFAFGEKYTEWTSERAKECEQRRKWKINWEKIYQNQFLSIKHSYRPIRFAFNFYHQSHQFFPSLSAVASHTRTHETFIPNIGLKQENEMYVCNALYWWWSSMCDFLHRTYHFEPSNRYDFVRSFLPISCACVRACMFSCWKCVLNRCYNRRMLSIF